MSKKRIKKKQKIYIILIIFLLISIFIGTLTYKVKQDIKSTGTISEPINEEYTFLLNNESIKLEDDNFITSEEAINNSILEEYNKGNYTIKNPYIIRNPYNMNPSSVLILFKTKEEKETTVTIKGQNNDDIKITYPLAKDHIIPINYLYNNYQNEITISCDGEEKTITIDNNFESPINISLSNNVFGYNNNFYLISTNEYISLIDKFGNTRSIIKMNNYGTLLLNNNHILVLVNDKINYLVEMDLMGYIYKKTELNINISNMKYLNNKIMFNDEENIYEYDYETNTITNKYNIIDILRIINPSLYDNGNYNIKDYTIKNNTLFIACNNSIISINLDTLTINYIFGSSRYWLYSYSSYLIKGNSYYFNYPNNIEQISINDDETINAYTLYNNKVSIYTYSIDTLTKKATITNKNINYTANLIKVNNNVIYNGTELFELDQSLNETNKLTIDTELNYFNKYSTNNTYYKFITPTTNLNNEENYEMLSNKKSLEYANFTNKEYTLIKDNNRLYIDAFDNVDYVTLISTRGNAYKYKLTNNIYTNLTDQISGKYYIFVVSNGIIYNTNKYIEI